MSVIKNKKQWIEEAISSIESGSCIYMTQERFMSILRFFKKNGIKPLFWKVEIDTRGGMVVSKFQ